MKEEVSMEDWIDIQQREREAHKEQVNRAELVDLIDRSVRADGCVEPLQGVRLYRFSSPTEQSFGVFDPAFCVIAQGSKEFCLGEERHRYDPFHIVGTVALPIVSHIIEASQRQPYLSLGLRLDPILVSSVMVEGGYVPQQNHSDMKAVNVSPLDSNLLDAVVRLVRLIDNPTKARVLAPLITQEIIYWLLIGKQGDRLLHIAVLNGYTSPIAKAIERLRQNFDQPIRIEDVAHDLGMSLSGFHQHFKSVTAMSPLQFQKQMRLQEARRLMLGESLDAASAGYRVGYDNPAHFSREVQKAVRLTADARYGSVEGGRLGPVKDMRCTVPMFSFDAKQITSPVRICSIRPPQLCAKSLPADKVKI